MYIMEILSIVYLVITGAIILAYSLLRTATDLQQTLMFLFSLILFTTASWLCNKIITKIVKELKDGNIKTKR